MGRLVLILSCILCALVSALFFIIHIPPLGLLWALAGVLMLISGITPREQ